MGLGPGSLLSAGAADLLREAGHAVEAVRVEPRDPFPTEIATAFRVAAELSRQVRMALRQRRFPIILAGNCFASLGVLAGHPAGRSGLVWLDAHADFHTPETTTSGFLDGMAISTIAGHCWRTLAAEVPGHRPLPPERILLLGARSIDPAEEERLREHAVTRIPVGETRADPDRLPGALERLGEATDRIHLHVDLDVLDPETVGPANRYAEPGGLIADELMGVVDRLRASGRLASATLSAYDPSVDSRGSVRDTALRMLQRIVTG